MGIAAAFNVTFMKHVEYREKRAVRKFVGHTMRWCKFICVITIKYPVAILGNLCGCPEPTMLQIFCNGNITPKSYCQAVFGSLLEECFATSARTKTHIFGFAPGFFGWKGAKDARTLSASVVHHDTTPSRGYGLAKCCAAVNARSRCSSKFMRLALAAPAEDSRD